MSGAIYNTHPSRTAPLCEDCKHAREIKGISKLMCDHPSQARSPVRGHPLDNCASVRGMHRFGDSGPLCGPSGQLFEQHVGDLSAS